MLSRLMRTVKTTALFFWLTVRLAPTMTTNTSLPASQDYSLAVESLLMITTCTSSSNTWMWSRCKKLMQVTTTISVIKKRLLASPKNLASWLWTWWLCSEAISPTCTFVRVRVVTTVMSIEAGLVTVWLWCNPCTRSVWCPCLIGT